MNTRDIEPVSTGYDYVGATIPSQESFYDNHRNSTVAKTVC